MGISVSLITSGRGHVGALAPNLSLDIQAGDNAIIPRHLRRWPLYFATTKT